MVDPRLCFVAMPFAPNLSNTFEVIERVTSDYCGLRCVRADKLTRSEVITEDVHNHIKNARFLIADLTDKNPNVFYEIGVAKGRDRRVILLVQDGQEVPFDLRGVRHLTYDPQNLAPLREKLIPFIRNAIST